MDHNVLRSNMPFTIGQLESTTAIYSIVYTCIFLYLIEDLFDCIVEVLLPPRMSLLLVGTPLVHGPDT